MQDDFPLTLQHIRRRLTECSPDAKVLTLSEPGVVERASFAETSARVDRLARALRRLGVEQGQRIATFAWNNQRHFELYFAIPCVGAVLHTLNVRLFEEQLTYIVNHAEDGLIFVDDSLVPAARADRAELRDGRALRRDGRRRQRRPAERAALRGADRGCGRRRLRLPGARRAPGGGALLHERHDWQSEGRALLASLDQPALDGDARAATGSGSRAADRVLAVVPMFHANAWGLPHGAALAGADLLLPDRFLSAEPLAGLIAAERPTLMGCVPTIFADLLRFADEHPEVDLSSLTNATCGGSAVPRQLMQDFEERHGVEDLPGLGDDRDEPGRDVLAAALRGEHDDAYWDARAEAGAPLPWVELRLVDDEGQQVARDGEASGEIEVRGPWVAARYFNDDSSEEKFDAGWLRTGDIASARRRRASCRSPIARRT